MTKGSSVGRPGTAAGKAAGSLHTLAIVPTEGSVAVAVAGAAGSYSRCDLRPFLQVQGHAVELQRTDASQEAFLSGRSTSYKKHQYHI